MTDTSSNAWPTELRLHKLGFIFQSFNLVPVLTVEANVEFPLLLQGKLAATMRGQMVPKDIYDLALKARDAYRQQHPSPAK